jgi:hypothetical protein
MQDIEDRCILLTSSMGFVDLSFQEHRMTEKHNMDQNPCITSLGQNPGVVSDNMTRGDDMEKARAQPTQGGVSLPHSLVGQLGFGTNEITLSTCVMLGR